MNNLYIVIGSQLHNYGGGCETWLGYFLEGLLRNKKFERIHVYHLSPFDESSCAADDFRHRNDVIFTAMKIKSNKKGSGFTNLLRFSLFAIKGINDAIRPNDVLLCVGSTYVALIGIVMKWLQKSVLLVTWIRSIAVEEMRARGSRYASLATMLEKKVLQYSGVIIANGKDTYEYYGETFPWYRTKMAVVENAVQIEHFEQISLPDFQTKELNVAYMGRYCTAKGFHFFPEASSFLSSNPNLIKKEIVFNAYGHGQLEDIINQSVVNHGRFFPNDVKDILQRNQVVVFLNDEKAAGGVSHGILEALAAGRLIVAWRNRVHCQILNDENSILVGNKDIDQLVNALVEIANCTDVDIYAAKCKNAIITAEQYTVERHIEKFYESVSQRVS